MCLHALRFQMFAVRSSELEVSGRKLEVPSSNDHFAAAYVDVNSDAHSDAEESLRSQQEEGESRDLGEDFYTSMLIVMARTIIITDSGLCARLKFELFQVIVVVVVVVGFSLACL